MSIMAKKPKISVIMAAYNAEKYLDESIKSILNQTFRDFEFIIFEDGSNDGTRTIIKKYVKKDKRIRVIFNKRNIGYVGFIRNLNRGIKLAQGKYIARQDADDVSLPGRLKKQYEFLEKNKDIFLCGTNLKQITEKGVVVATKSLETNWKIIKKKLQSGENQFVHTSIMFRNKGLFYHEKAWFVEDFDLYLRLLTQGYKMANLEDVLVHYRLNPDSITSKKAYQHKLFLKKTIYFYHERLKYGKDSYDSFDPALMLKIDTSDIEREELERRIIILLKSADYNRAKGYLKKYIHLKRISILKWLPLYIFIYFPIIYELRKKILCRTK